ncbi:MAG: hypothetical protein AB1806_17690 [Acidobacteriota bacterium]
MRPEPGLAAECVLSPPAGDARPSVAEVLSAFDGLRQAGWRVTEIASQCAPSGGRLPIQAYATGGDPEAILIAGIHGREPAGVLALARYAPRLVELGSSRGLLVMPLLNPWGYLHHTRYGPSGRSVTDSDHVLGRSTAAACLEAAAITGFVMRVLQACRGGAVLDLHEDPVYEAPDYQFDGSGSYLYVTGRGARDHPVTHRVLRCLERSRLPLVRQGVTRFGERLEEGIVLDSADGSIDELLARNLACSPVLTVENLLSAPDAPALATRVDVYVEVLDAFFGLDSPAGGAS